MVFGALVKETSWYMGDTWAFGRFFGYVHDDGTANEGNENPGREGLKEGRRGNA